MNNSKRPNKISLPRLDSKDNNTVKPKQGDSQANLRSRRVSVSNNTMGSNANANVSLST